MRETEGESIYGMFLISFPVLGPSLDQQVAMKSKMAELQVNCQLLYSQVSNMKTAAVSSSPEVEVSQSGVVDHLYIYISVHLIPF